MSEQPAGQLRFRAAQQIGVSYPKRTIELVAVPYGAETLVPHPSEDRMIFESFERGAFDGIERRANRVRVNRDHDITRTIGRAVAFHTSRAEGLVAELRIAQTQLGDETLALADEGILDASVGFLPMPGGERWETRNKVTISRAWLGHIAMTPDPAYEGSQVLAVRTAGEVSVATPNLDEVRSWRLADEYARLEAGR